MTSLQRITLGFFLTSFLLSSDLLHAQTAMTWNIRYNNPNDGENWWEYRKEWVAGLIQFYEPEVLGTQEGLHDQVTFLDSALSDYRFVGVGRDDGGEAGEYTAIFYQHDVLEVVDSGTFWLSETPEKVSVGWDASMERICTWAKFKRRKDGKLFWVFNAHLDHRGAESRVNALKLIIRKANEWNQEDLPLILMGDLNARPQDPPLQFLNTVLHDSRNVTMLPAYGPEGTFNDFKTDHKLDARIDHIFVNDRVGVLKYGVISEVRNNRTPSDHLPVFIEYTFR